MPVSVLPFRLEDSPASFNSSVLGTTWIDPKTGYEYQIVKNTDGAVLSPGMAVTKETASTAFEVDKAAGTERIYGIVVNSLTGTTVAVSDAFWVMKRGVCYAYKCVTGAIAILGPVFASAAGVRGFTGTVGKYSAIALAQMWNVQALSAHTTAEAVGTQVLVVIK